MKKEAKLGTLRWLISMIIVLGVVLGTGRAVHATVPQEGKNKYVHYTVGDKGFDVRRTSLTPNGNDINTTMFEFGDSEGYYTEMKVGDLDPIEFSGFQYGKTFVKGDVAGSISAKIRGKSVLVTYTIKNTSNESKAVRIGSCARLMIGNNVMGGSDIGTCSFTENGGIKFTPNENIGILTGAAYDPYRGMIVQMNPASEPFTTKWYGNPDSSPSNPKQIEDRIFENRIDTTDFEGSCGVAWSWSLTIPAGETMTRVVDISIGQSDLIQIDYEPNGGTGTMESMVEAPDGTSKVTLTKNIFTREGYTFQGWDTDIAAETVVYEDEEEIIIPDEDTTLYAVWKAEPKITTVVNRGEDLPGIEVKGVDKDLLDSLELTAEEKALIDSGEDTTLYLDLKNADNTVASDTKDLILSELGKVKGNSLIGLFLEMSLRLQIGDDYSRTMTTTGDKEISAEIEVPENMKAPAGTNRTYFVVHVYDNAVEKLPETTATKIPIVTRDLSIFALCYRDEDNTSEPDPGFYSGIKINQKKDKIKISWNKEDGISRYEVYASYCGGNYPAKATKTTKSNSVTIKKIKGKKIDFSKNIKIYIAAYDATGKLVGKSLPAHFAGRDSKKYKNPKEVVLSTKAVTLLVDRTLNINASIKMEKGKKKALSAEHVGKIRYRSTNTKVATVDSRGNVTGINKGTCTIYVYARNGLANTLTLTVN